MGTKVGSVLEGDQDTILSVNSFPDAQIQAAKQAEKGTNRVGWSVAGLWVVGTSSPCIPSCPNFLVWLFYNY